MFPRIKIPAALARITTADLLAQPEIRAIGERLAAKQLEERRKLAVQLAEVSGEAADTKCASAVRAFADAEAKLAAARAVLDAAIQNRAAAQRDYSAASFQIQHRRVALELKLRESADPRLASFDREELEDLWNRARYAVAAWVEPATKSMDTREAAEAWAATASSRELAMAQFGGERPWVKPGKPRGLATNANEAAQAMSAIRETQAAVRAAQLEALDAEEVAALIDNWRDALAPVLARIGLQFEPLPIAEE